MPIVMTAPELRRARKRLGLQREELALKLNVTAQTVWRWEKGQTRMQGAAAELVRRLLEDKHAQDSAA